ncbi:hypothetical protein MYX82_09505 [Acidobacteria bacterium AH-259-D05]|nr:hypothetical protein [Acidobacteria bacterium AH-259-D05]
MKKMDWITLDYLEFFCQQNQLVIGCKHGEDEIWISPLGPHPSHLTSQEVQDILRKSARFEVRTTLDEELELTSSHFVSRKELEQQIRRLMN